MNDYCVLLPFTGCEGLRYGILCTILEEKPLDHFFVKRPVKPEFINILLHEKNTRRIYGFFISQT